MLWELEERPSDSPFVEHIWRTRSFQGGMFNSIALSQWQMCIWTLEGKTTLTLRGPETYATQVHCPPEGEFVGITFKVGTIMPHLPASNLVDGELHLPDARRDAFYLQGSVWQYPDFENADTFVERLVREGLLVKEPVVDAALQGQLPAVSIRSVQRRFSKATGLTHSTVHQIQRARHATMLLQQGLSILDTVELAGYADQPHLTRSLRHYVGLTPAQLLPENQVEHLSVMFTSDIGQGVSD